MVEKTILRYCLIKGTVALVYVDRTEGGMGGWISLEEYLRIDCYRNC
jgi:hypothetical protein